MATTSETLAGLIRDKIAAVSDFTGWTIGLRRKEESLGIGKFPAILVVAMEPEELSIDTDNRSEIGYGYGILLAYKDEVGKATDANKLPDWVRLAQQAIYSTVYSGFLIEDIEVRKSSGLDLKGLRENCLVSDFYFMLSIMEDRFV